jgi:hypothetical protein
MGLPWVADWDLPLPPEAGLAAEPLVLPLLLPDQEGQWRGPGPPRGRLAQRQPEGQRQPEPPPGRERALRRVCQPPGRLWRYRPPERPVWRRGVSRRVARQGNGVQTGGACAAIE